MYILHYCLLSCIVKLGVQNIGKISIFPKPFTFVLFVLLKFFLLFWSPPSSWWLWFCFCFWGSPWSMIMIHLILRITMVHDYDSSYSEDYHDYDSSGSGIWFSLTWWIKLMFFLLIIMVFLRLMLALCMSLALRISSPSSPRSPRCEFSHETLYTLQRLYWWFVT